jgi:peptidyl-prolyl cis-trans isomerase D
MVEYKKATHIPSVNADEPAISAVVANMEVNEVSAPIKGNNAVYVVKVTSKTPKNGTFNATAEKNKIESQLNVNQSLGTLENTLNNIYPKQNNAYKYF